MCLPKGFPIKAKMRFILACFWFTIFVGKVDVYVAQTLSIRNTLVWHIVRIKTRTELCIRVLPFIGTKKQGVV